MDDQPRSVSDALAAADAELGEQARAEAPPEPAEVEELEEAQPVEGEAGEEVEGLASETEEPAAALDDLPDEPSGDAPELPWWEPVEAMDEELPVEEAEPVPVRVPTLGDLRQALTDPETVASFPTPPGPADLLRSFLTGGA